MGPYNIDSANMKETRLPTVISWVEIFQPPITQIMAVTIIGIKPSVPNINAL